MTTILKNVANLATLLLLTPLLPNTLLKTAFIILCCASLYHYTTSHVDLLPHIQTRPPILPTDKKTGSVLRDSATKSIRSSRGKITLIQSVQTFPTMTKHTHTMRLLRFCSLCLTQRISSSLLWCERFDKCLYCCAAFSQTANGCKTIGTQGPFTTGMGGTTSLDGMSSLCTVQFLASKDLFFLGWGEVH